jgi:hypothetical protein
MQSTLTGYVRMREPKKKLPSERRRGAKTPEDLKDAAESLSIQAANLLAQANAMEEMKMKAITVDGQTKWERGLKLVSEFVRNVEVAIIHERTARG